MVLKCYLTREIVNVTQSLQQVYYIYHCSPFLYLLIDRGVILFIAVVSRVTLLIQIRIKKISVGLCSTSIFKDTTVVKHLSLLHDKYIIVSADKAPNVIVFVCKSHYVDCLIKELGIDNSLDNPTYTPKTMRKRKSSTIISLFYGPFEFQPNIKN